MKGFQVKENSKFEEIFKHEDFGEVRTIIGEDGEPWFMLSDIGRVLEIKNSRDFKKRLNPKGVDSIYTLTSGGQQQADFINEANLYNLVNTNRKLNGEFKARFLNALQESGFISGDTTFVSSRKEIEFISDLEMALSEIDITGISQYNVDNYKIDFYIPSKNIAVEYDEQQHFTAKNQKEDKERQSYIEKKLGCTFVRCNYKDNNIVNIMKVLKVLGTF